MTRVRFVFDVEKDSWNIWSKINNTTKRFGKSNISKKIVDLCEGKTFEESKRSLEEANKNFYNTGIIKIFIEALEKSWGKVENEFFERLEKITGKKFEGDFTCYITSIGSCPYHPKERWFMNSIFYSLPKALSSIGHELLHIHFHDHYFSEIEKQIGIDKTNDLREALTVLLNLEFKDILIGFDEGYEVHKELREFISSEWKKDKNFEELLAKCVVILKNK